MIPLKDNLSCKVFPIATILLIVLNCAAFLVELTLPAAQVNDFFMTWAVVPQKVTHAFTSGSPALIGMALVSVVTAMFLHGGWLHLIGNMVFLQAFGKAVENRLGAVRYVLLYLVGGFAAWGMHWFTDMHSAMPALGASGAIAFVLGAYLVFFPKSQFKAITFAPLPILVVVQAFWLLPVWFISQLQPGILGLFDPSQAAGVAYWAHIGGFLAGMIIAGIWSFHRPKQDVCYTPMVCECTCSGGDCKKNHNHKVQLLRFWKR